MRKKVITLLTGALFFILLMSGVASTDPLPVPMNTNRVIHISDLHFSDLSKTLTKPSNISWLDFLKWLSFPGSLSDSLTKDALGFPGFGRMKNLENYFLTPGRIGQLGTNVVLITGDLTDKSSPLEYDMAHDFIDKLTRGGYAVYVVPGNHDYYNYGNRFLGHYDESLLKRKMFINSCLTPFGRQSSHWPNVVSFGNTIMITLDAMQGELSGDERDEANESGYRAQGLLGWSQLAELKKILAQHENDRKNGTKILVALHHSPFRFDDGDSHLTDSMRFLGIIANKIDALAFGHTGQTQDTHQPTGLWDHYQKMYGISLINSENLEDVDNTQIPISVIDLQQNWIEVYNTCNNAVTTPPKKYGSYYKPDNGVRYITPDVSDYGKTAIYNYADHAPEVKFQSGDRVIIYIDGAVQVGGSGTTCWRYVNPSDGQGKPAALYFGSIYIPGITPNGLEPIRNLVADGYGKYLNTTSGYIGLQFTIPNIDSLPENSKYLKLSYTDDGYSDNGYYAPDPGDSGFCQNSGPAHISISITSAPIRVTGVTLDKTSLKLVVGDSASLTATVSPANAVDQYVSWSSSNPDVANVLPTVGKVTALKVGTAVITAMTVDGGYRATCNVEVGDSIRVTGVRLDQTSMMLQPGNSATLHATVTPANATNQDLVWSSNNLRVAIVSPSGIVTALSEGTAVVTVSTKDGGCEATCIVRTPVKVTGVTLDKTSLTLQKGTSATLIATVTPAYATDKTLTWSSSNPAVATVSSSGVVTAIASGTAVIVVSTKDDGFNATCTINAPSPVKVTGVTLNQTSLTLAKGNSATLIATVSPGDATDETLTWSSSNTTVATVSSSGIVTALGGGTAVITVLTKDGGFNATCTINVSDPIIITFDDVPSGTNINNYYSDKGVVFGTHVGKDPQRNMATGNVYAVTEYDKKTNNILSLTPTTGTYSGGFTINERTGYIKIYFPKPVRKVSIQARPILMAEYSGIPTDRPFLQAFNSDSGVQKLLGQAWYPGGTNNITSSRWETLSIERPTADISYIYFSSSTGGQVSVYGEFDTLQFEY